MGHVGKSHVVNDPAAFGGILNRGYTPSEAEDLSLAKEEFCRVFKLYDRMTQIQFRGGQVTAATVSNLEKLLKNLNLRVSAWHQISRSSTGWN